MLGDKHDLPTDGALINRCAAAIRVERPFPAPSLDALHEFIQPLATRNLRHLILQHQDITAPPCAAADITGSLKRVVN